MLIGELSVGEIVIGGEATTESITSAFSRLLKSTNPVYTYLIEISAVLTGQPVNSNFPYAIGEEAIGGQLTGDIGIVAHRLLRYGSKPFFTKQADSVSLVQYKPKVQTPFNYETSIPYPLSSSAIGDLSFGVVTILHKGNDEDQILSSAITGRDFIVKVGGILDENTPNEYVLSYDEFGLGLAGVIDKVTVTTNTINFGISDKSKLLDIPLINNNYTGQGGLEGDENLIDVAKPKGFGLVRNATPVLVNGALYIYQVNDGPVEEFISTEDKGVPLGILPQKDISELGMESLLDEWETEPGYWITDLSRGMIRLGAKPEGRVTCTFKGDKSGPKGYVDSIPDIIEAVLTIRTSMTTSSGIDGASFNAFTPKETIGYYIDSPHLTVRQFIDQLLSSSDAWGVFSREGNFTIGRYRNPLIPYAVDYEIDDQVILDLWVETIPATVSNLRVGYRHNWSIQTQDELASSVDESEKEFRHQPELSAFYENLTVKSLIRDAIPYDFSTFFDSQEITHSLLIDMLSKYGRVQWIYHITVAKHFLKFKIGQMIWVVSNKFNLQNGRRLMILGIVETSTSHKVDLVLWGV